METNQLEEFEKAFSKIPKHLVDWKGLREWSNAASNTKNNSSKTEEQIVESVRLVSIPSIGEFEQLLHQVSPSLPNKAPFNESDLLLLNIWKDLTIVFCEPTTTNSKNVTGPKKDELKDNENKENKENKENRWADIVFLEKKDNLQLLFS